MFRGDERATHTQADFSALAKAPLAKDQRAALQAIERVSLSVRFTPHPDWQASAVAVNTPPRAAADGNTIRFLEAPVSRAN